MPVDQRHPSYAAAHARWVRCRDVAGGEEAVKARRTDYLPALEGQSGGDDPAYLRYLARAQFFPAYERTVEGLLGSVLRRPPQLEVPDVLRPHLDDLTLAHEPLESFVFTALSEVLSVGRGLGMVDWRAEDGTSAGARGRPYWLWYPAEAVINWREAWVGGWWQPTLVVLREVEEREDADGFGMEEVETYREFRLKTAPSGATAATTTLWRRSPDGRDWRPGPTEFLVRRGRPLPFLPLVFFGPRGTRAAVERPPLLALADVSLSLYRTLADLEHGRHFTALPTPWVTGWTNTGAPLTIGSGQAWVFPPPEAKVGMLEFTGQGLGALERAAEDKRRQLAVLGARLLEEQPRGAETAEAVRLRHAGEHASLSVLTGAVSLGLTRLLRQHAYWLGDDRAMTEPGIGCELNRQFFDERLRAQDLQALTAAWQSGGLSAETYYWNLQQGGVARPGVTWLEERRLIEAEEGDAAPRAGELAPGQPAEADEEGADGEADDDDAADDDA